MRAFRRDENTEGEEWGGMDSELEAGSVPGKEEDRLHRLIADFLSSSNPKSPDPNLVGDLYMATFEHIVHHLAKDAGDREFAEDAVQEAFEALQIHLHQHQALPDKPMTFLLTVARNFLRKRGRDEKRHRNMPLDAVDPKKLDRFAVDPREAAREPIGAVESAEVKEVAYNALEDLDDLTRKVVELKREGKEFEEIAPRLGIGTPALARMMFNDAVHHVKDSLGEHFSSYVTTAEFEVRRWISSRKSAAQAIDLLPPPYNKVLCLLLVKKMTEKEAAARLGVSPGEVKRHHEHSVELFHKKYKMTEDELLEVLWHGK